MENVAEFYLQTLFESDNPGLHLTKFLCELTSRVLSREDIVMMSRLVKIYGRQTTYFSVLEVAGMYDRVDGTKSLYGILAYFCKKRLEDKLSGFEKDIDLTGLIKETEKSLEKLKNKKPSIKLDPFGEIS